MASPRARKMRWLRWRAWLAMWAMVFSFWSTTATGVSWALPMPHWAASVFHVFTSPSQLYGLATGRIHEVGGNVTRATSGASGRAPGTAPGQLPAYQPHTQAFQPRKTGESSPGRYDAATSVLVSSMSNARQDTYHNKDGSYTVHSYTSAVNYQLPDGSWAPIDTTLRQVADPSGGAGRSYQAKSVASGPTFAGSASASSLVSFQFDSKDSVSFGIQGAAGVAPTVSGSVATYSGVLRDTDVVLEPSADGVKESLVLHSASAPTTFVYPLTLTGVSASLAADGSIQFTNHAGAVVGEIPHGSMSDADFAPYSDLAPTSPGVTYALATVNGGPALVMTLDASWIDQPSRKFPVTVDPTLTPVNSSSSTYASTFGSNNNSTNINLQSGTSCYNNFNGCGSTNNAAVSFLAFPSVSSSLANDYVSNAQLTMYNTWASTCTPEPWAVSAVTSSWTATQLMSWTSHPSYSAQNLVTSETDSPLPAADDPACGTNTSSTNGNYMTAQLNPSVFDGWTGGASPNYGLAVWAPTNSGGYPTNVLQYKHFASNASGVASSNYPYLSLTYQADTTPYISAVNPPSGEQLLDLTPELSATATDPDSFPGKGFTYEFQVMDDSTGTPVQVADSGTVSASSWLVPSQILKWSGDEYWEVRANDQLGWGSWSQPVYFNLSVAQPPVTSQLGIANSGDGYNAAVGNYTSTATDADIQGTGPALSIVRTYNSLDPRSGLAFGSGWSTALDSSAAQDGEGGGDVVITFATGQQVRFGANQDGSFSAPSGMIATLTAAQTSEPAGSFCPSSSVGYCLVDQSGTTYAYTQGPQSGPWQLSMVVDISGRATLFSGYSGSHVGTLTSCVSGCFGSTPVEPRTLSFFWSTPPGATYEHVTKVSTNPVSGTDTSTDAIWTYTYNGDDLASVCDPTEQNTNGTCNAPTVYGYQTAQINNQTQQQGSQYSASVLDAGPQAYWRLGDTQGAQVLVSGVSASGGGQLCVDDSSSLTTNGNKIQVYGCNESSAQSWTLGPNVGTSAGDTVEVLGLCLDVTGGATAPGTLVDLNACTGGAGQLWSVGPNASLVNPASGLCLDDPSASQTAGTQLDIATCAAGPQQSWNRTSTASDAVIANEGTYNGTYNNVTLGVTGPLSPQSPETAASFDGSTSYLALPPALVTGQSYLSIGVWFKTRSPGILFAEQNQPMGSATAPTNATPSLYVGTDGLLHAGWYNGSTVGITSTNAVNDGKWHYAVLAAAGSTQTLILDGQATNCETSCTLAGQINNLSQSDAYIGAGYSSGLWPAEPAAGWSYFSGQIGEVAFYQSVLSQPAVAAQYADGQSASALLASITTPGGVQSAQVQYDVANDRVIRVTNAEGGVDVIAAPTVTGSSAVYKSAVLGSQPQGYWRLSGTGIGGPIPVGGPGSSVIANNEVTQHTVVTTPGGCVPHGACTPMRTVDTDPQGDGYLNNVTIGATGSSRFSDTTGAQFDGSTSNVQLPGNIVPASGATAIELWFNTTTPTGMLFSDQSFALGGTSGTMISNLYIGSDSKVHGWFWNNNDTGAMTSPNTVTDGKWHDVVISTDGADQSLYLDGALVASQTTSSPVATDSQPYVYVGAGTSGGGWPGLPNTSQIYFKGSISDVSVYRHALSTADVAAHFGAAAESSGTTPVLTAAVTDPLGHLLTSTYDPTMGGRQLTSTDANGNTTSYGYDSGGYLNTVTDPLGDVTTTGHDIRGNQVSVSTCQDMATEQCSTKYSTYWPDDSTSALTPDPRDNALTSQRNGRSASASDPTYMTQYAYNTAGEVTSTTDPLGRSTTQTYSAGTESAIASPTPGTAATCTATPSTSGVIPAGLTLTKKTPGGAVTSYAYYQDGDLAIETSPLGATTTYVYDGLGRVLFQTLCADPVTTGGSTTFTSSVTSFSYDALGRVVKETDPLVTDSVNIGNAQHQQTTSTVYTADGKVAQSTVADAVTGPNNTDAPRITANTYDPTTGLLTKTVDPAGATTTYGYDAEGNKTSQTDPNLDQWSYAYDGDGNMLTTTLVNYTGTAAGPCQPSSSKLVTVSDAYDISGRLASTTDAMCREATYTYYDNGLTATTVQAAGTSQSVTDTKQYDAAGNIVSDSSGNGKGLTQTSYDAAGEVSLAKVLYNTTTGGVQQFKYNANQYSLDGKISSTSVWQDGQPAVEQTDFTYDAAGDKTSQVIHDSTATPAQIASLSGLWTLADGKVTSAKDGSGDNRPATVDGNAAWSPDAPAGLSGSLSLDGVSGQAVTSSVAVDTSKDYSVSAWVKLNASSTAAQTVVSETGTAMSAFYLQYLPAIGGWRIVTTASDSGTAVQYSVHQSTASPVNVWTHLVGTYNAETKTLALYVNGALIGTVSVPAAWSATGVVMIGSAVSTGGSNFTNGEIADVQLWNKTLGQTDVDQLYNEITPPGQHPVGSWLLNDGVASAAADSSGNNHPAAVGGAVMWNNADGGAAVFNGTNAALATSGPVLNTTQSYSVSAWVNEASITNAQTFVAQDGVNQDAFLLQNDPGTKKWRLAVTSADSSGSPAYTGIETSAAITLNSWTNLVGEYNATAKTFSLYVNGTLAGTTAYTTAWASSGSLVIGRNKANGVNGQYMNGQISDVQVYQQALTAAQVSSLAANQSLLPAASGLLTTKNTYDQRGLMTSQTDPMNNTTTYQYDTAGRKTLTIAPAIAPNVNGVSQASANPMTYVGYDTFGGQVESMDSYGRIMTAKYDSDGRETDQTSPSYTQPGIGAVLQGDNHTDYNADGTTADTIDPAGGETTYVYDQLGDPIEATSPSISVGGATTTVRSVTQYDQDGEVSKTTDPDQAVTTATYDNLGERITQTQDETVPGPVADVTQYQYDAFGDQTEVISPNQVTTESGYDAAGERTSATDSAGNTTNYTYNVNGSVLSTVLPDGSSTTESYDLAGNATSETDYSSNQIALRTTSATYNADGQVASQTDALNNVEQFGYDADGNLTSQTEAQGTPAQIVTNYGYDLDGERTWSEDGDGAAASTPYGTITTYNTWGQPESQILPATSQYPNATDRTFTTVYDLDENQIESIEPGGVTVTYGYDALGDLTSQSGSGGGTDAPTAARTFGYDAEGQLLSASTSAVGNQKATSDTFSYDARGDLVTADGTTGTAQYSSSFGYNNDGQMASRADASGTSTYSYNSHGQLFTEADPLTGATMNYTYNNLNQVHTVNYGGSADDTRTFGYDSLHRLTSDVLTTTGSPGTQVAAITYGYNNADEEISQTTAGLGTTSPTASTANNYTYDQAGRLQTWDNSTNTVTYGYDQSGNRTGITTSSDATKAQTSAQTLVYNQRGQLQSDSLNTYTYTARGTMLTKTANGGAAEVFAFDAYNQMDTAGGTNFTYDAAGRTTVAGTATLTYSGLGNNVASDGADTYSRDPEGGLVADGTSPGTGQFDWSDQHGNVTAYFTPAATALAGSTTYDPLGNQINSVGHSTSLGYQGGYTTGGNVNMDSRWYTPATGQFDSADTQSNSPNPASVNANPFAYGNENPLTSADPTGHLSGGTGVACGTAVVDQEIPVADVISDVGCAVGIGGALASILIGAFSGSAVTWVPLSPTPGSTPDPTPGPSPVPVPTAPGHTSPAKSPASTAATKQLNTELMALLLEIFEVPFALADLAIELVRLATLELQAKAVKKKIQQTTYVYIPPPPPLPAATVQHRRPVAPCAGRCTTTGTPDLTPVVLPNTGVDSAAVTQSAITAAAWPNPNEWTAVSPQQVQRSDADENGCQFSSSTWVAYGNLDNDGRATGVSACLTGWTVDYTGRGKVTPPDPDALWIGGDTERGRNAVNPAGYGPGLVRGHLLGRQLGGQGDIEENLVPLYAAANDPGMKNYENQVAKALEQGQRVYYSVIPKYEGNNPVPWGIEMYAVGSGGLFFDVTIQNR